jgi:hypothetical protein
MGLCKAFNALPSEILEEDAGLIETMMTLDNAYYAIKTARQAKGDAIHKLPPSVGRIIAQLQEMGVYKGGL